MNNCERCNQHGPELPPNTEQAFLEFHRALHDFWNPLRKALTK